MLILLILATTLALIIAYFIYLLFNHFKYWKNLGICCDEPSWIFGTLKEAVFVLSFFELFQNYYNRYKNTGPFAGFYWFCSPAVFVMDLALIKRILIKDFDKFADRGWFVNEKDDPLSGHLFNLEGEKWRYMRSKLTPTFTPGKMKFMFPTVVTVAQQLLETLTETIAENPKVEIRELMARYTTDVIGSCAFGLDCHSLKDPKAKFHVMSRRAVVESYWGNLGLAFRFSFPKLSSRLRMRETVHEIEDFFMNVVKTTVKYREENHVKRNDFMNLLLELQHEDDSGNLSIQQMAAQVFIFLVAGADSSSNTLTFALYELAFNAEVQERARAEINRVLQEHNQELSYECLSEMKYLEQILQEILRLYPSLVILNRVALEDYAVPDHPKFVIRKGMPVLIPIVGIHRDERYFPHPDKFDPENFSAERVALRDSLLYMPFGEGPRNCIGSRFGKMQTMIGLIFLLQNFKFSVCEETVIPMKFDKESFLLTPDGDVLLKVTRISKN